MCSIISLVLCDHALFGISMIFEMEILGKSPKFLEKSSVITALMNDGGVSTFHGSVR